MQILQVRYHRLDPQQIPRLVVRHPRPARLLMGPVDVVSIVLVLVVFIMRRKLGRRTPSISVLPQIKLLLPCARPIGQVVGLTAQPVWTTMGESSYPGLDKCRPLLINSYSAPLRYLRRLL